MRRSYDELCIEASIASEHFFSLIRLSTVDSEVGMVCLLQKIVIKSAPSSLPVLNLFKSACEVS